MTADQFRQLQVGDRIYHPETGIVEIERVQKSFDYDRRDQQGRPLQYTWAFETVCGRYCKADDWIVSGLQLVVGGGQ